jgi:polyphosphate kinase 2
MPSLREKNTALLSGDELLEAFDEEIELEMEDEISPFMRTAFSDEQRYQYFHTLVKLQSELIKLQKWLAVSQKRVVVLFEGRDAAGKGGVIKRITQRLDPRTCRVAALPAPNSREKTQWYFQRYVAHLPAAGEMVLYDRSWYNRAGVEKVMGFCTDAEYEEFFQSVPEFEKLLIRSGIQLIKYWFSVTEQEQEARFLARIHNPMKQWKLSPTDLESRRLWEDYTRAKETMFERTHTQESPWWIVNASNKRKARLNCMAHLLAQIDYEDVPQKIVSLPPRQSYADSVRKPLANEMYVPEKY